MVSGTNLLMEASNELTKPVGEHHTLQRGLERLRLELREKDSSKGGVRNDPTTADEISMPSETSQAESAKQTLQGEVDELKKQLAAKEADSKAMAAEVERETKAREMAQWALQEGHKVRKRREEQLGALWQAHHILDFRCAVLERQNFALLEALSSVCGQPAMPYPPTQPCHYRLQPQLAESTGAASFGRVP
ncbi:hypothetical protein LTR36_000108 [Oleoguttula mirabilis]|uniref:Uncharacterized protein n=1 Tax=Oleoguttula mirabilis TaxID=1507867 RepID=A0AAV9K0V5_9PEZI|nr:hypothetical protein LTR36_000108 [Oleoguttula mirabilis]